jgi:hypothetical protein
MMNQSMNNRPPRSMFSGSSALNFLGGALLAGLALWWIAVQSGPQQGNVVIHVAEPHVTVSVDDRTFRVGAKHHIPITCELPPGEHSLTMIRGGSLLYSERFTLRRGEERVLTAWHDPSGRAAHRSTRAQRPEGMRGLEVPLIGAMIR